MMVQVGTIHNIRQLARELGVSDGELLQLAREAAHDCTLVSVDFLTEAEAGDVLYALEVAQERVLTFA